MRPPPISSPRALRELIGMSRRVDSRGWWVSATRVREMIYHYIIFACVCVYIIIINYNNNNIYRNMLCVRDVNHHRRREAT